MRCAFILGLGRRVVTPGMMLMNKGSIYTILLSGNNKKASFLGNHKDSERENQMTTSSMKGHTSLKISVLS